MNARLENKLRLLAAIIVVGTAAGLSVNFLQGRTSHASLVAGTAHARVTAPPASKLAAAVPRLRNFRRLIASVINEDS